MGINSVGITRCFASSWKSEEIWFLPYPSLQALPLPPSPFSKSTLFWKTKCELVTRKAPRKEIWFRLPIDHPYSSVAGIITSVTSAGLVWGQVFGMGLPFFLFLSFSFCFWRDGEEGWGPTLEMHKVYLWFCTLGSHSQPYSGDHGLPEIVPQPAHKACAQPIHRYSWPRRAFVHMCHPDLN